MVWVAVVSMIVALVAVGLAAWQLANVRRLMRDARSALGTGGARPRIDALDLGADVQEAWLAAEREGSARARRGAHNLLVLEVEERLGRGSGVSRLAWRIAAAATVASVLAVSGSVPQIGLGLAGLGAAASGLSYFIGRMADREARAARERWNALIRLLGGSFTNG